MPSARRDLVMLTILITAVVLLIWNGSTFFRQISLAGTELGREARTASIALTLNVALILFGWRQYVDFQHEAERRADGERRAAILASTDAHTGLLNRKGFADRVQTLAWQASERGQQLAMLSIQINRLKAVSDRHGYDVGDTLLRSIAAAMTGALGEAVEIARLSGDEFAIALALDPDRPAEAERAAEITESSLVTDIDLARSIVTSLKNQGVRLELDDFGTGFSSLSHLRSLPFDVIKIDRSFVANIQSNTESIAIVRAVTTLASALGVPVCVEGIESEAAHAAVLGLGCAVGQGWYFGKPMPGEQAAELLAHRGQPQPQATPRAAAG